MGRRRGIVFIAACAGIIGLIARDVHDGGRQLRREIDEIGQALNLRDVAAIGILGPEVRGIRGVSTREWK